MEGKAGEEGTDDVVLSSRYRVACSRGFCKVYL